MYRSVQITLTQLYTNLYTKNKIWHLFHLIGPFLGPFLEGVRVNSIWALIQRRKIDGGTDMLTQISISMFSQKQITRNINSAYAIRQCLRHKNMVEKISQKTLKSNKQNFPTF